MMSRQPTCLCGECRLCKARASNRAWYQRLTIEERRERMARRDRDRIRAEARERQARLKDDPADRVKRAARAAVAREVKNGRIERQPCEACGASQVDAHHDDYAKPLDVRWLCRLHHMQLHTRLDEEMAAA